MTLSPKLVDVGVKLMAKGFGSVKPVITMSAHASIKGTFTSVPLSPLRALHRGLPIVT